MNVPRLFDSDMVLIVWGFFVLFCFVFMFLVLGLIELLESVDFSFSSNFEYFQPLFLQILSLFLSVSYDVSNYTHIRSLKVLKFSDTLFIKKNFFFLSASFLIVCIAMCCWVLFGDTVTLLGKSLIFWILILRFVRQDQNSVNSRANYSLLARQNFFEYSTLCPINFEFFHVAGGNGQYSQPWVSTRSCFL